MENKQLLKALAFDAYIRRCAKNRAADLHRQFNRQNENEKVISALSPSEYFQLQHHDHYDFDQPEVVETQKLTVSINDEKLAKALRSLTPQLREVLLLSFFFDMSDQGISDRLNISRRTVAFRRTVALKLLRSFLR